MSNLHPESEYYLHTNGTVHYKPHGDVQSDSPFVVRVWDANEIGKTPYSYLDWLKELKKLGANTSELKRLVEAQNLTSFISDSLEILGLDSKGKNDGNS